MTLSRRAQDYLATLRREEPVPVAAVAQLLAAENVPAHPAWLLFHEQFAGYVEDIGSGDLAAWGLAFGSAKEFAGDALTVSISRYKGTVVSISCADVHPSWDYNLTPEGKFNGPPFPAENFTVKVERNALMWEFVKAGPVQRLYEINGASLNDLRKPLLEELAAHRVPEASDGIANYYASSTKLLLESLGNSTLKLLVRKG
jgi:hypothetical protein